MIINEEIEGIGIVPHLLPDIFERHPEEIKDAVALRNAVTLGETCKCGVRRNVPTPKEWWAMRARGDSPRIYAEHVITCNSGDVGLKALLVKYSLVEG